MIRKRAECTRQSAIVGSLLLVMVFVMALSATVMAETGPNAGPKVVVEHFIISPDEGALRFFVVSQVRNEGDQPLDELRFALPPNHEQFHPVKGLQEGTYEVTAEEVISTEPLEPGETREVLFFVMVPWDGELFNWTKPVPHSTGMFFVLVPEGVLTVASQSLEQGQVQAIDDVDYRQFYASQVSPGAELLFHVMPAQASTGEGTTGNTTPPEQQPTSDRVLNQGFHGGQANVEVWMRMTGRPDHLGMGGVLGFGLGVFAVIGAVVGVRRGWFSSKRETPSGDDPLLLSESEVAELSKSRLQAYRKRLMKRLVSLELEYRKGGQSESSFDQERKGLLKQLVRLELALKDRG